MNHARLQDQSFACRGAAPSPPSRTDAAQALDRQPCLQLEFSPEDAVRGAALAALVTAQKAIQTQPASAWAWHRQGAALLELKRMEEAVSALRKAVALAPGTTLFHYDLGLALAALNQTEAAREEFAGIVAQDPELKSAQSSLMIAALTNLALSQEKLGQRDAAIATLLPASGQAVGILFNLGFLHFRARRFEAALPYAQAAYVLKPNNEDIVHQYGAILSELNRPREALGLLKQAVELNDQCAGAWYDLGLAYARLKHRRRARACFRQSLHLDPEHAWSHYDLACLDALTGRRAAAFEHLQQAVDLGFSNLSHLRRDADLRTLRRDARWQALIATLEHRGRYNN